MDKVEHPFYTVCRERDGSVTIDLKGVFLRHRTIYRHAATQYKLNSCTHCHTRCENSLIHSVVEFSCPIPVWSLENVVSYGVMCGVRVEEALSVLAYFHQVRSVLYFSQYQSLCLTVLGVVSFVVDVLKPIFRHDHKHLEYNTRFRGQS